MGEQASPEEKRFERRAGLTIALLAAVLAINDLFGGKFGDDEIIAANERADAYAWYQSKSQKQTLNEHQRELLETLQLSGAIAPERSAEVATKIAALASEVERYEREKREILLGSEAVGPDGRVLEDESGELGRIVGANVWKQKGEILDTAGSRFDLGTLFLQVCLVLGAVSLVLDDMRLKRRFYAAMTGCGVVGTVFTVWALVTASAA